MIAAALGVCGLVLAWFAWRARVGAHVRAAGGARLAATRALLAGELSGSGALIGALGGTVAAGVPGTLGGATMGALWPRIRARRGRAVAARALDDQVPEMLRAVAAAVRSGRNLRQSLAAAAEEAGPPLRDRLDAALARLSVGGRFDDALDLLARDGSDALTTASETLRVGRDAGAALPAILDNAIEALTEHARIARDRRAATTQARMSAAMIGGMPVAFYVLVGGTARARLVEALASPAGIVVIVGGVLLDTAGVAWVRSMTRAR